MRKIKGMVSFILAVLLVAMLLPLGSIKAHAEEGEGEPEILGATYKVGDIIKFGHYEQDGNTSNGKEEIEWQVLKVESDRVLVISKYALDCKKYNETKTDVTWETCTLRTWFNNDFKNMAFSSAEQAKIPTVTIANKNNPKFETTGGNNTNDQIFCLSLEEMESYFGNYSFYDSDYMTGWNQNLICTPTQYAENNGAFAGTITEEEYNNLYKDVGYTRDVIGRRGSYWWLRSPGYSRENACIVNDDGYAGAGFYGDVYNIVHAVRPALFIDTSSVKPTSIKLNKTSATMYYGDEMTLTATLAPSNVTEKTITWTSSNTAVATVNNGKVKAKTAGETTITAMTVNGLSATCNITVLAEDNPSNPFADVKSGNWKYNAALYVYENGYMTGKGALAGKVLFSPDTPINRSMFVQTLYNVEGKPAVTYVQKFGDVKESDWYAKPVTWAAQNGIVAGNANGTFGVNGVATREQLAQMFYKYAVYKGYDTKIVEGSGKRVNEFPDAEKVSSWAVNPLNWALSRGIMSGTGKGTLNPKGSATRVESATMLRNFMNAYKDAVPKLSSSPELLEEEGFIEENVDEEIVDEEIVKEDVINKEIVDKEIMDEEVADEEAVDENADEENKDKCNEEETVSSVE